MPSTPHARPAGFSRRTLLAVSAAGLAVAVAGCTSPPADLRNAVTGEQVDGLARQVAVQAALVAAFESAGGADPALATELSDLAAQAQEQLDRLRAASPGSPAASSTAASSTAASSTAGTAPAGPDARAWLRGQVAAAAASHAGAALDQSGARAALLGSIAAGLRGHDARLA